MASLRDIKRRIVSVKNTQKITKAMKMVAASKLRRAQAAIVQARPYAYHMRDLVNAVAMRAADHSHPLLQKRSGGKIGIIIVTSDRGLCGGFNTSVVNEALRRFKNEFKGRELHLVAVGKKGADALRRRGYSFEHVHSGHAEPELLRLAGSIVDGQVDAFLEGGLDEVYCLYNEFKSAVQQQISLERMLPYEPEEPTGRARALDFVYEPSQDAVFEALLRRNLRVQMHRILFESSASEYGARMTAMDSATRNAGDVIEKLTLKYNRARQNAITTELIEVISGAAAL